MSDEEIPSLSQTDIEPAPLRLQSNLPPHAGDAACMIIPSRSLASSLHAPPIERSQTDSISGNETEDVVYASINI